MGGLEGATVTFQTTLSVSGTETSVWARHLGEDAIKRAVGCAVIMLLPSAGLEEVFDCLRDVWSTYHHGPYKPISPRTMRRTVSFGRPEAEGQIVPDANRGH